MADFPQYGISSLVQAIPSIQYGFQGFNTGPQQDILGQLRNVGAAQMDINNPLYKKLYGQYRQQGRDSLSQGIAELGNQNRKLAANGRVPLLDQERGGEQMWRGLMQGYQNADNQAGQDSQLALALSGKTLGNAFTNAGSLAEQQQKSRQQQTELGWGNVGNVLKGLFGL